MCPDTYLTAILQKCLYFFFQADLFFEIRSFVFKFNSLRNMDFTFNVIYSDNVLEKKKHTHTHLTWAPWRKQQQESRNLRRALLVIDL